MLVSLSLVLGVLTLAEGGPGSPKKPPNDFHTFREVTVHLKEPKGQEPIKSTDLKNGLHVDGLNLQIFEDGDTLLFDIDLLLNRELLPQTYFQKYHRKVRKECFLYASSAFCSSLNSLNR